MYVREANYQSDTKWGPTHTNIFTKLAVHANLGYQITFNFFHISFLLLCFSFFLPNEKRFRLISVRVDGPLLKKNDSKHTNEQKTLEVCFYPFFGEVVSLEQILGGSKVSACLLPTHLLALLLLLPGCLQGLKLVKLQLFKAQQASNTHMHTLPPLTTPLIDYQPATWIAFCSWAPLLCFHLALR